MISHFACFVATQRQSMNFLRYRAVPLRTYRHISNVPSHVLLCQSTATRRLCEFTIHPWIQFSLSIVSISYTSEKLSRDCYILYCKAKISRIYVQVKISIANISFHSLRYSVINSYYILPEIFYLYFRNIVVLEKLKKYN